MYRFGLFIFLLFACSLSHSETKLYVPLYLLENPNWESRLILSNPDPAPVDIILTVYNSGGNLLTTIEKTIRAGTGENLTFNEWMGNAVDTVNAIGSIIITSNSENLRGIVQYKLLSSNALSSLPLSSNTGKRLLLPLLTNSTSINNSVLVNNTTDQTTSLQILIDSLDGNFQKTTQVELKPHAILLQGVHDIFPGELPEDCQLTIISNENLTAFTISLLSNEEHSHQQMFTTPLETIEEQPTEEKNLDSAIMTQINNYNIPAIGTGVIVNGEVIFSKGYGLINQTDNRKATAHTPFMLASISKTFTGTALMKAWENEDIDLQENINNILPFEVNNPNISGEQITLWHLLTHTSGIRDNWSVMTSHYSYGTDSTVALGDFMRELLSADGEWYDAVNFASFRPGESWLYSNTGAALAGYLLEYSSGIKFDDYSDINIFQPLGMTNTGWHLEDFDQENIAIPYYSNENGDQEEIGHYGYPDYPNGQARSSAADLSRFLATIMNGGKYKDHRILSTETVNEMLSEQFTLSSTEQMAYSWFRSQGADGSFIGHTGGDAGVATIMFFDPDKKVGYVLLLNITGPGSNSGPVMSTLSNLLFEYGMSLSEH